MSRKKEVERGFLGPRPGVESRVEQRPLVGRMEGGGSLKRTVLRQLPGPVCRQQESLEEASPALSVVLAY